MGIDLSTYNNGNQTKNNRIKKTERKTNFFAKDISLSKKFNDKKKEQFYKELTLLIRSGVDFKQALNILAGQYKKASDKKLINQIKETVIVGKNMHEAIEETGQFSTYECFSVKIGEETRRLEEVMEELQRYFTRKIKMRRQLVSVFTYPAFVLVITFGVLYFMLNSVVPMFSSVFRQFGGKLPALTQKVIALSENFSTIALIITLIVLAITIFHILNKK